MEKRLTLFNIRVWKGSPFTYKRLAGERRGIHMCLTAVHHEFESLLCYKLSSWCFAGKQYVNVCAPTLGQSSGAFPKEAATYHPHPQMLCTGGAASFPPPLQQMMQTISHIQCLQKVFTLLDLSHFVVLQPEFKID